MGHEFQNIIDFSKYTCSSRYSYNNIASYIMCKNCKLEIVSLNNTNVQYFYLNGIEVFPESNFLTFKDINLTCKELMIKSLLE